MQVGRCSSRSTLGLQVGARPKQALDGACGIQQCKQGRFGYIQGPLALLPPTLVFGVGEAVNAPCHHSVQLARYFRHHLTKQAMGVGHLGGGGRVGGHTVTQGW